MSIVDQTEVFHVAENRLDVNELGSEMEAFVKKLAFPRFFGTSNEARAREVIKEELDRMGLNYDVDPFSASDFFMKHINQIPYFLLGIAVLIFTIITLVAFNPVVITLYAFALIVIAFSIEEIIHAVKYRSMYSRWATIKECENIVVEKPASNQNASEVVNLYLLAHSDSKSEKPDPTKWFTVQYLSVSFGTVLMSIHAILYSIFNMVNGSLLHPAWFFCYGIALAIIDMLRIATAYFEGDSPGAADDASGVALAIELQRRIKDIAFKNVSITAVITGAEEVGEAGAYNFLKKRMANLDPEKNHFIILDTLTSWRYNYFTSRGFLFKPFSKLVRSALEALIKAPDDVTRQFTFNKLWMPPPVNTDHSPIVMLKFPAFYFESSFSGTHTSRDTADKIDFTALAALVEVLFTWIKKIDCIVGSQGN